MKHILNINRRNPLLLILFFSVSIFLLPKSILADDSIRIELDKILFFESGNDVPGKNDRKYINHFKPETKYINIELNVKNLNYKKADKEYKITFIWNYLNGEEFGRTDATFNVKSEWSTAYINRSWGFTDKGNWPLGRFTAQILINDSLFAEKDFFITKFDEDFISLPEENKVIENLQNIPEDIRYKFLHQYKIIPQPYFNYFYDINFSKNGKDIAYSIAHYESYSNSSGSYTERDMFLFRNNKQVIPNYFMIHAEFDINLKNLRYFGSKLTSSNIYDSEGYGYDNGLQIYSGTFYIPIDISPDYKKHVYILNTMPHLKSSFTWDNAYEFLMINNKKVQPEQLKKAKSIRITKSSQSLIFRTNSIVFIKNLDNSYNALYTAKYKFDKQTHYALFNEEKRVSPQFDGYISIPYLSPDEKNVAYIVKDKKEWFVMMNDKKITKAYKEIKASKALSNVKNEIIFSNHGENVIYQAKIDGDWYVMKGDEIISDGFSKIESITLNSAGDKIAYIAKSGKARNVYINKRKISEEFDRFGEEIRFSPDGNNIAYAAGTEDSMFVMINNRKISPNFKVLYQNSIYIGKQPLAISKLTFNKKGDKLAYIVAFEYSGEEYIDNMKHSYVMINDAQVSPEMYNTSIHSKIPGELFYAGIEIFGLILHHVKIEF